MTDPEAAIAQGFASDNVLHAPSSNYSKERVKHESHYTVFGAPQRPYTKRDWPSYIFRAGPPDGGMGAIGIADAIEVASEREADSYRGAGYRLTPGEAIEAYEAQQLEFATLAANLEYQKKHTLSPAAAAEVERAQDAHAGHLPMVPVTPIAPRRKDKE